MPNLSELKFLQQKLKLTTYSKCHFSYKKLYSIIFNFKCILKKRLSLSERLEFGFGFGDFFATLLFQISEKR